MTIDELHIDRMTFYANIGATAAERELGHVVHVDLVLRADLSEAGRSDALGSTIDYGEVVGLVGGIAEDGEYNLIEALAERIADRVLDAYAVEEVAVRVEKPYPSVEERVERVAVEIERSG